jgi:hypothetical protein
MKAKIFMLSLLALAAVAPAANALTVQNDDKAPYTIKVTPTSGKAFDVSIKASAKADVDCSKGCTLALNGKTQVVDAKSKLVKIESGAFAKN